MMPSLHESKSLHQDSARVGVWTLAVGEAFDDAHCFLPISRDSPWCAVLGDFPLPMPDALEEIGRSLVTLPGPPDTVRLIGSPAACLLPALWLRSIWLEPGARLELHWPRIAPPGHDPAEALCTELCTGLLDHLHCDDHQACEQLWGLRTGTREPIEAAAFDAMLALLESWSIRSRTGPIATPDEWMHRITRALHRCAKDAKHRIALYGGGTHTRAVGPALAQAPVEIVAIIDDGMGDQNKRLWGFPVVTRETALSLNLDAVILSANSVEHKLWELAAPLRDAGIEVIRLYADAVDLRPETFGRTTHAADTPPLRTRLPLRRPSTTPKTNILAILASPPGVGRFLSALDDELTRAAAQLISILDPSTGAAPALAGIEAPTMSLVALAEVWPAHAPLADLPDAETLEHCAAYERAYWRPRPDLDALILRGVRAASWLIENAFQQLQPGLVLLWNAEQGFAHIAANLARKHAIPTLFCERSGISPGIVVDPLGVHATSDMLLNDTWRKRFTGRPDPQLIETGKRIAAIMLAEQRENASGHRSSNDVALLDNADLVILPSVEASLEARTLDLCARHGSPLGDPFRAVDALLRTLGERRRILLKPHPRDPRPERWAALCARHGAHFTEDITIHDVLRAKIPFATTSQALAWLGISAGACVLSLNKRPYTNTGAVVDAHDSALLRDAVSILGPGAPSGNIDRQMQVLGAYALGACHTVDPTLLAAGAPGVEALTQRLLTDARTSSHAPTLASWFDALAQHALTRD